MTPARLPNPEDFARRAARLRASEKLRRATTDVPRSFPLTPGNADLLWRMYRLKIPDVKTLHRVAGLPLKKIGEGHGARYTLVTAAVDRWLLTGLNT